MGRKALILGATGLVGRDLLQQLLSNNEYKNVTVIVRKAISLIHPKLKVIVADLSQIEQFMNEFEVDDVFCCLGTTIKKAGSKKQFMFVDYELPLRAASLSKKAEVKNFIVISSMGANPNSRIFYSEVKGKLEMALSETSIKGIHILRPSLLLGDREEFRLGEKIGEWAMKPLFKIKMPLLQKYAPIEASIVAKAMIISALSDQDGINIVESNRIRTMTK